MKQQHTRATTTWEWFTNAKDLPSDWNATLPANHYLLSSSLLMHSSINLPAIGYCFCRIRKGGVTILIAAFQVLTIGSQHADSSKWPIWQKLVWKAMLAIGRPRLLIAGNLFRHDIAATWYDAERLSAYKAFRLYHEALGKARAKACCAAVLVKDVPPSMVTYFHNYAPKYLALRNDISMQMPLPQEWASMQDYEAALKHKYAQRYRKVRHGMNELEVVELNAEQVAERAEQLFELYSEVTDNQAVRLGLLSKTFLPTLKHYYGEQLKVWALEQDGEMVAFASAWVYGSQLDMFYIGFRYAKNAALNLYFNILFLSIEKAIVLGKDGVILGRTALEAKARLGCNANYLHTFLYVRNKALSSIIASRQEGSYQQEGEWENRHPFRN